MQKKASNNNNKNINPEKGAPGDDGWTFGFEKNWLWQLKLKLQWTGYLQYIPPFTIGTALLILSYLERFVFGYSVVLFPLSTILYSIGTFDFITAKLGFAPPEPLPSRRDDDCSNLDLIKARRSCRNFQRRKLTEQHREELMGVVRSSLEQNTFSNDRESKVRIEYIARPLHVWPAVNCSEFLVAITPKEYSKFAVMDVARCLEHAVVHSVKMGLGTCWIGPGADHESIIQELGDRFNPDKDHLICVCAIGYKSMFGPLAIRFMSAFGKYIRKPLNELIFRDNKCTIPLQIDDDPAFLRMKPAFVACRWGPSSYNSQTTRAVVVVENDDNDDEDGDNGDDEKKEGGGSSRQLWKRVDFYRAKDSKYYAAVALGIWQAHFELVCKELGVKGKFCLPPNSSDGSRSTVPIYDISWVFDEPILLSN